MVGALDMSVEGLSALPAPPRCEGFAWRELAHAPHGPFGAVSGSENLLHANGFLANHSARGLPPLFTATSCCFSADLSFPTVWYDFDTSDEDFGALATAAAQTGWSSRREVAFFRGSIYWFQGHGRTRAFARSLVAPSEIDADWYEELDTSALETDGLPHFGDLSRHARHKYLLSLEGHSFWSFRLRQLSFLGSAVLHQASPCHEFWHALLRPYEHYLPVARDLADLRLLLRYARRHDASTERMASRMRRLAPKLLSRRAVLGYVQELLTQYAALQTQRVSVHPKATPLGLGHALRDLTRER